MNIFICMYVYTYASYIQIIHIYVFPPTPYATWQDPSATVSGTM